MPGKDEDKTKVSADAIRIMPVLVQLKQQAWWRVCACSDLLRPR